VTEVSVAVDTDGPSIRISDDRPDKTDNEEKHTDADLSLAVTRLALDQLGGRLSVEWTSDGRRAVVVFLPTDDTRRMEQSHTTRGVVR
jgi:hypothetical protein